MPGRLGCDQAGLSVSESSGSRVTKAYGLLLPRAAEQTSGAEERRHKTRRINQIWQSDAARSLVPDWGHRWLVSVSHGYSRRMVARDVVPDTRSLSLAAVIQAAAAGLGQVPLVLGVEPNLGGRAALLTNDCAGYISKAMRQCLRPVALRHVRTPAHRPQITGKIAGIRPTPPGRGHTGSTRVHASLDQLGDAISRFVTYWNSERCREALRNVSWNDVRLGRREEVLARRRAL